MQRVLAGWSSPAAGTAREIHPAEPVLINHLNYSTASSFQDLSRSVFTQNRVENAPGPTFRVSSIWPLWGVSGGSDRQGCSVRGAPAPATCHIAGLIASDSSICTYPRDKSAVHGSGEKGTGERDERGYPGMRDAGSILGTPRCSMLAASLVPRCASCSHCGEKQPHFPKAHRWGARGGVSGCNVGSNLELRAKGAPVPVAHPLAVLHNDTELSPCPGLHRASPAKPLELPALHGPLLPPRLTWERAGCYTPPPVLEQCEPDPKAARQTQCQESFLHGWQSCRLCLAPG